MSVIINTDISEAHTRVMGGGSQAGGVWWKRRMRYFCPILTKNQTVGKKKFLVNIILIKTVCSLTSA